MRKRIIKDDSIDAITRDVQAWLSAGNYRVVGYPPHDHVWVEDDGVVMTNPVIHHRTCERCRLRQERRGGDNCWTFDMHENLGHLVDRLTKLLR